MNRLYGILSALAAALALFLFLGTRGCGERRERKVLRLALDTEPKTLDPIAITDTLSDGVARKVHNTLVRFVRAGDELRIEGDLAERFEVSADGKTYTFTLRRGVRFHNGREVRAADARYSLARLLTPESKRVEWLKPMVVGSEERYRDPRSAAELGIRATGEYTLEIRLNAPFAPFLAQLCTSNCAVVPREAVETKARPFSRFPIGTGPFKLKEWKANEVVILERNDDYFRGRPKLDEVRFYILREPSTRLEKFFAGELDAAGIPYGRMKEARERAGPGQVLEYNTFRTNYLGIGMPNGKFKDKADLRPFGTNRLLRQALNYAIDREYLCETVLEGRGVPGKGILPPPGPPPFPGYKERPGWPKDLAKAKALLAEAGYPGGAGLPPVMLLHRNDPDTMKVVQTLAHDLEAVGIRVESAARDWNTFLEMTELEPRPLFALGWVADYPDPDNFLYVLFHSSMFGEQGNHTWYSNPKVDELTEKARALMRMEERAPLYQQAEDLILDDAPWICTYHVRNVVLISRNVKGLRENCTPLDTGTEFPQVDFYLVDKE